MIPLIQLTHLTIHYRNFPIGELIELLYFSPNIHTLVFDSISLSKINATLIRNCQTFQTVSNKNKITTMSITGNFTLEDMKLFNNLCPRLEHLKFTMYSFGYHLRPIIEFLFSGNNTNTRHLISLCFSGRIALFNGTMQPVNLPDDSSTKLIKHKWHCWW
jgi:hypothetical protein